MSSATTRPFEMITLREHAVILIGTSCPSGGVVPAQRTSRSGCEWTGGDRRTGGARTVAWMQGSGTGRAVRGCGDGRCPFWVDATAAGVREAYTKPNIARELCSAGLSFVASSRRSNKLVDDVCTYVDFRLGPTSERQARNDVGLAPWKTLGLPPAGLPT